jgi:uncharacterized protein YbjT (DUF2867 family)
MRIAIVGASGGLGTQLLTQALARSHEVHALTRNPRRLMRANPLLTVFQGDLEHSEQLLPLLVGCSHVVWAARPAQPDVCMETLLKAVKRRRIERFVFVSRLGVGESATQSRQASSLVASMAPRIRTGLFASLAKTEDLLRTSGVPHVILRATQLTDQPSGEDVVVCGPSGQPPKRVSRSDLARFILLRVLEGPGWDETEVTIGARRK